jgi:hypothetical protein
MNHFQWARRKYEREYHHHIESLGVCIEISRCRNAVKNGRAHETITLKYLRPLGQYQLVIIKLRRLSQYAITEHELHEGDVYPVFV